MNTTQESTCYCGKRQPFHDCCEPYLKGEKNPVIAEALMRSRYTAFVRKEFQYIKETMIGPALDHFDQESVQDPTLFWCGLDVLRSEDGQVNDDMGWVLFEAKYRLVSDPSIHVLRENSEFHKQDGRWYYYTAI